MTEEEREKIAMLIEEQDVSISETPERAQPLLKDTANRVLRTTVQVNEILSKIDKDEADSLRGEIDKRFPLLSDNEK